MTMDKSLKVRHGKVSARSVLSRAERIQRLKAADRWQEGDDPFGLPKVRVFKLSMKKKKKKKEEEAVGGTPEAAAAAGPTPAAAPPTAPTKKSEPAKRADSAKK